MNLLIRSPFSFSPPGAGKGKAPPFRAVYGKNDPSPSFFPSLLVDRDVGHRAPTSPSRSITWDGIPALLFFFSLSQRPLLSVERMSFMGPDLLSLSSSRGPRRGNRLADEVSSFPVGQKYPPSRRVFKSPLLFRFYHDVTRRLRHSFSRGCPFLSFFLRRRVGEFIAVAGPCVRS